MEYEMTDKLVILNGLRIGLTNSRKYHFDLVVGLGGHDNLAVDRAYEDVQTVVAAIKVLQCKNDFVVDGERMANIYYNLAQYGNTHRLLTGGLKELKELICRLKDPKDADLAQKLREILGHLQVGADNSLVAYKNEETNFAHLP